VPPSHAATSEGSHQPPLLLQRVPSSLPWPSRAAAKACAYAAGDICGDGSCQDGPSGSYSCNCTVWGEEGTSSGGGPLLRPHGR